MSEQFLVVLDGDVVTVPDGYRKVIKNKREIYRPRGVNTREAFLNNRDELFDYCGFCNRFGRDGWKIATIPEYLESTSNGKNQLAIITHFTRTVITSYVPRSQESEQVQENDAERQSITPPLPTGSGDDLS